MAAALDAEPFAVKTDRHMRKIREAWERVIQLQPVGTPAEEAAKTHTEKRILHWKRPPTIPHTWWCVPTTEANILGFWDNYAKGSGTFLGYGRFIKYWFEHPSFCHLSTGPQANCQWSSAIHNNVPDIIDVIIDPKIKTWRKGFTSLADRISKLDNYKFSTGTAPPSAYNNWSWNAVKKEMDSGRPAFWSFKKHTAASIGYRITNSGQKLVITYDSYGVTFSQKIEEYTYDWCNGFRWVIPGGGTNGDHMIIDSPDGGENLTRMIPYDITWWVWGVSITRSTISFSLDGGRTWTTIASDVNTKVGKNTYQWLPDKATQKGRIRIQCYSAKKVLIAADGSQEDFTVKTASFNNWGSWKSLGKPPLSGQYGVERIVVGQNQDGRLEVFAMAGTPSTGEFQLSNTALWHNSQPKPNHKGSWGQWQSMGKPSGASWPSPTVGQNKDGRLEVFVPGSDGAIWHKYQSQPNSGSWGPWKTMGNPPGGIKVLSQIDAAANKDGRLEVFTFGIRGKGPSSVIAPWHIWQVSPNNGWSKWAGLGAPPGKNFESLTVAQNKACRLEVFAIASDDNSLWQISQK